jgi:hypothetical protein
MCPYISRSYSILRNITTYVHQAKQEAEEHKVRPYIPQPLRDGPRNIKTSVPRLSLTCLRSVYLA